MPSVTGYCFHFYTQERLFSILLSLFRKSMQWTREHDILLCREVLALEVYKHKKVPTKQGDCRIKLRRILEGAKPWDLNLIYLSGRSGRDSTLFKADSKKMKETELAASGISVLLEAIAERERDGISKAIEKKGQAKATAEDFRNQALERMGQTKKPKSEDGQEPKESKSRRSSNEALQSMQDKVKSDMDLREKEVKIRKIEEETKAAQFQAMFTQQQSVLHAMAQQHAQQQQQNQHMQMLMAQQSQAMMSVLEKLLQKEWLKRVWDFLRTVHFHCIWAL